MYTAFRILWVVERIVADITSNLINSCGFTRITICLPNEPTWYRLRVSFNFVEIRPTLLFMGEYFITANDNGGVRNEKRRQKTRTYTNSAQKQSPPPFISIVGMMDLV